MKSPSELIREPYGKILNQPFAIFGPCFSPLLLLNDQPTDLPIASHHLSIDGLPCPGSGPDENGPDLLVDTLDSLVICHFSQWSLLAAT